MLLRTIHSGKLLAYVTLSFADLYLTYTLVQSSRGAVYEGNPIANAWLASYGWAGLATFKIAAMLLVSGVAAFISLSRPQTAGRLLGFACCAVAFVVIYSCWLANVFSTQQLSSAMAEETWIPPCRVVAPKYCKANCGPAVAQRPFAQASRSPAHPSPAPAQVRAVPVSMHGQVPRHGLSGD